MSPPPLITPGQPTPILVVRPTHVTPTLVNSATQPTSDLGVRPSQDGTLLVVRPTHVTPLETSPALHVSPGRSTTRRPYTPAQNKAQLVVSADQCDPLRTSASAQTASHLGARSSATHCSASPHSRPPRCSAPVHAPPRQFPSDRPSASRHRSPRRCTARRRLTPPHRTPVRPHSRSPSQSIPRRHHTTPQPKASQNSTARHCDSLHCVTRRRVRSDHYDTRCHIARNPIRTISRRRTRSHHVSPVQSSATRQPTALPSSAARQRPTSQGATRRQVCPRTRQPVTRRQICARHFSPELGDRPGPGIARQRIPRRPCQFDTTRDSTKLGVAPCHIRPPHGSATPQTTSQLGAFDRPRHYVPRRYSSSLQRTARQCRARRRFIAVGFISSLRRLGGGRQGPPPLVAC